MKIQYRAVLSDYSRTCGGGGGMYSNMTYEQLPKTDWYDAEEAAERAGNELNRNCEFFVTIEERVV